jgi:hypothetical protein
MKGQKPMSTIHREITFSVPPKPFVWTKTAEDIFERLKSYCLRTSDSGH